MRHPRVHTIVFVYNSFGDPLVQNTILTIVKGVVKRRRDLVFHLITFEQSAYRLDKNNLTTIRAELAREGIHWYPLLYHNGRMILVKKAFDLLVGFFVIFRLKILAKADFLLAFANVAASISYPIAAILNIPFAVYSYEPHSLFLLETGQLERSSLSFRLLNNIENRIGKNAYAIITGTYHMINYLKEEQSHARLFRAPTPVDSRHFYLEESERERYRDRIGVRDEFVIVYAGKFGGIYFSADEVARFYAQLRSFHKECFFLILTRDDELRLKEVFLREGLPADSFLITYTASEMRQYLNASDLGFIGVPGTPSQRFRSPTKTGEYLACGLPYLVNKGVSEDDKVALENGVGFVIDDLSLSSAVSCSKYIKSILEDNRVDVRRQCSRVATSYRNLDVAVDSMITILES
jgi:hypothetical protein